MKTQKRRWLKNRIVDAPLIMPICQYTICITILHVGTNMQMML